jgi:hypothetical protein
MVQMFLSATASCVPPPPSSISNSTIDLNSSAVAAPHNDNPSFFRSEKKEGKRRDGQRKPTPNWHYGLLPLPFQKSRLDFIFHETKKPNENDQVVVAHRRWFWPNILPKPNIR